MATSEQAEDLGPLVEAEVALTGDLDPVVDEPDRAGTRDRGHDEQA